MPSRPSWPSVPLALVAMIVAATQALGQTGPPTLENLLGPSFEKPDFGGTNPPVQPPKATADRPAAKAAAPRPAVAQRLPVPEPSAVDEALVLITEAYDDTIRSATADPDAAVATFRKTAEQTTDPARTFALLVLAERLALEAGKTSLALDTLASRATRFDIDGLAARHAVLAKVARDGDSRPDGLLFEMIVETVTMAAAAERFDLADAAADLAAETAKAIEKDEKARIAESRKKREPPPTPVAAGLIAEAARTQKSVREQRRQVFEYTSARDRLATTPDDAEAAEIVGRHLCFVKQDWPAGLPMLARGRDEGLRNLAAREVAQRDTAEPASRLKLAHEWWKMADTAAAVAPPQSQAMKSHAAAIYREIAGKLTDPIDATLARKRASAAEGDTPPPAPPAAPTPPATPEPPARPTLDSVLQDAGS